MIRHFDAASGGAPPGAAMPWLEGRPGEPFEVPGAVVDVAFRIHCPQLPVDHAWALGDAIGEALPWLSGEPAAGLHQIRGGASANGWERPPDDAVMHLPRRCRLVLRLPARRVPEAEVLSGRVLDVGGFPLTVGQASVRALAATDTIISHHLLSAEADEAAFEAAVLADLHRRGITVRKMLCGRARALWTPHGSLATRSLLLADLDLEDSVRLQAEGIGGQRRLGCGLFVPHKNIDALPAYRSLSVP